MNASAFRFHGRWIGFAVLCLLPILFMGVRGSGQTYDNLILSRMGVAEILRYLEAADHQKGLTEEQIAAKYILGEIPEGRDPPARASLEWKALPPSEQRQLKVIWFREHYRQLDIEDVTKHVNIEYLKARATAEFRENPLEPPDQPPESDIGAKIKVIKGEKPVKAVRPRKPSDTAPVKIKKPAARKKSDTETQAVKKPVKASKSPVTAILPSVPPLSRKSDTGAKSETVMKKLPWYGIPNKMKNE